MTNGEVQNILIEKKVVAVVRMKNSDRLLKVIDALIRSAAKCIEFAMTFPNSIRAIENAANWINHGAGSEGIASAFVNNNEIENEYYFILTENSKKLCFNLGLN